MERQTFDSDFGRDYWTTVPCLVDVETGNSSLLQTNQETCLKFVFVFLSTDIENLDLYYTANFFIFFIFYYLFLGYTFLTV